MRGTIEQVFENESRRNGQKYMTVVIGGERYSVWDTQYFDQLQQGADIEYEFRQSGEFKNITEVHDPSAPQEHPDSQPDGQPAYQNHRDRQITRLSCLKSAAEIIAPSHLEPDAKRDLTIHTARSFERYVAGDDPGALPADAQGEHAAGHG